MSLVLVSVSVPTKSEGSLPFKCLFCFGHNKMAQPSWAASPPAAPRDVLGSALHPYRRRPPYPDPEPAAAAP